MSNVTSENCLLVAHQARRQLNKEQNVRGVSFDVQSGLVILEISFKHTCTKKIFMHTAAKKISHLFSVEKKHNNWYSADTWSMAWLPLSWRSINCWLIVGGVEWLMYWSTLDWMSTKISQLRCQSRVLIEVIDQYLTLEALRTHDSKHFPILSYLTSLVCTTINTKWAVHKARHAKSDLVCH